MKRLYFMRRPLRWSSLWAPLLFSFQGSHFLSASRLGDGGIMGNTIIHIFLWYTVLPRTPKEGKIMLHTVRIIFNNIKISHFIFKQGIGLNVDKTLVNSKFTVAFTSRTLKSRVSLCDSLSRNSSYKECTKPWKDCLVMPETCSQVIYARKGPGRTLKGSHQLSGVSFPPFPGKSWDTSLFHTILANIWTPLVGLIWTVFSSSPFFLYIEVITNLTWAFRQPNLLPEQFSCLSHSLKISWVILMFLLSYLQITL